MAAVRQSGARRRDRPAGRAPACTRGGRPQLRPVGGSRAAKRGGGGHRPDELTTDPNGEKEEPVLSGYPSLPAARVEVLEGARAVGVPAQHLADVAVLLKAASACVRQRCGYLANQPWAVAGVALAAARQAAAAGQYTIAHVYCLLAHIRAEACGRRDLSAEALELVAAVERRAEAAGIAVQLETAAAQRRAPIPG